MNDNEKILLKAIEIYQEDSNVSFSDEESIEDFYREFVFKNMDKYPILKTLFINDFTIKKYKNLFTKKLNDFDEIVDFIKYYDFQINGYINDLNSKIAAYKKHLNASNIEYIDDIGEEDPDISLFETKKNQVDELEKMLINTFRYSKANAEMLQHSCQDILSIKDTAKCINEDLTDFIYKKRTNKTASEIDRRLSRIEEILSDEHEKPDVFIKKNNDIDHFNSNAIWFIFVIILLVIILKL